MTTRDLERIHRAERIARKALARATRPDAPWQTMRRANRVLVALDRVRAHVVTGGRA
jgi:hypothetical protein